MGIKKGLNKVILAGNLGADPELKYFDSGKCVVNFNLCTTEYYNDKNGEKQEEVNWHRCVAWDKGAELIEKLFKKGDSMLLTGKIRSRSYEDKNKKTVKITEIVVEDFSKI